MVMSFTRGMGFVMGVIGVTVIVMVIVLICGQLTMAVVCLCQMSDSCAVTNVALPHATHLRHSDCNNRSEHQDLCPARHHPHLKRSGVGQVCQEMLKWVLGSIISTHPWKDWHGASLLPSPSPDRSTTPSGSALAAPCAGRGISRCRQRFSPPPAESSLADCSSW
jgi:hypothetical protein